MFKFVLVTFVVVAGVDSAGVRSQKLLRKPLYERENYFVTSKHMSVYESAPRYNSKVDSSKRMTKAFVNPIEDDCKKHAYKNEQKLLKEKIKCKPRETVIYLESTSKSTLIPNAVIVNRCDGMCSANNKCIAKETKERTFRVKEIKNNNVTCTTVVVSEDVTCRCACPKKATDCNANQVYDPPTCQCQCRNEKDYENCLQKRAKGRDVFWNTETCECACSPKKCTTGTRFHENYCKCVPIANQLKSRRVKPKH